MTEITVQMGTENRELAVYKAANKPFLLVGPVRLSEDGRDFFFVNRKQVVNSGIDKCGEAWGRFWNRLYVLDDFTTDDRIRAPYWDEIKSDPKGSITFDKKTRKYRYLFHMDPDKKRVCFEIPEALLTPDMEKAVNKTLPDKCEPDDAEWKHCGCGSSEHVEIELDDDLFRSLDAPEGDHPLRKYFPIKRPKPEKRSTQPVP